MKDLSTRERIKALYTAGEEAVTAVIESLLEENSQLRKIVEAHEKRIMALEERLKKNSHNSDKPPSSDGLKRPTKSSRPKSSRKSGGQKGHNGNTLKMVDKPDNIEHHSIEECSHCHHPLANSEIMGYKKRQVFDIPLLKLVVTEHRAAVKKCSNCGTINTAAFPAEAVQAVQYGPRIKSFSVYLMQYQLLPSQRTTELLEDILSHPISEGTLYNWNQAAYYVLEHTEAEIKKQLLYSPINHFDEIGIFTQNKLKWLHVTSNSRLTYYAVHSKRGRAAMDAINILPQYQGKAVHDFWNSYFKYECEHAICNAHLLRELTALSESFNHNWPSQIMKLLLTIKKQVEQRPANENSLDPLTLQQFEKRYDRLVGEGLRLHPVRERNNQKRGRPKQTKATNLLIRLKEYRSNVLAFMYDFRIPFTNNLAERDLRMMKVKQKISGTFRSPEGTSFFCRIRGFISTVKKNNLNVLDSISQTFLDSPPSFRFSD
jgi:transposase